MRNKRFIVLAGLLCAALATAGIAAAVLQSGSVTGVSATCSTIAINVAAELRTAPLRSLAIRPIQIAGEIVTIEFGWKPWVERLPIALHFLSQRDRFPSLRRSNAGVTLCARSRGHYILSRQGGAQMSTQQTITDRILELLRDSQEWAFDALVARSPEFNASDIYNEISRLSRNGKVTITRGVGIFTIRQVAVVS